MRKLTIAAASALIAAACGSATAADLRPMAPAAPAAAVMAPIYNWNGLYIGLQGGGGWGDLDWTYTATGDRADHKTSGGLIGGTLGFNFQASNWVFGVEADYAWASLKGSTACPNPAFECESRLGSFGTARARVGYAVDSILIYGTGGVAFGDQRIRTIDLAGGVNSTSHFSVGWTAGGGIEWGFAPNWSLKAEALYFDLGTKDYVVDNGLNVAARQSGVLVRGGVNWRFNWGGGYAGGY